jgi:SAM-dependent methyltransferase
MSEPDAAKNIVYASVELAKFFSANRIRWDQFYESEREIIARLGIGADDSVLDIGCGCGGLGLALREKFGVLNYTGVEINLRSAAAGKTMNPDANISCGDILDITRGELAGRTFDVVFSLSCIDWNVRFDDMLAAAWGHVADDGHFISTFRLTTGPGCSDFAKSYQPIGNEGGEPEVAAYVVVNANALLAQLLNFDPAEVNAFGYWGSPSSTAVTPYETLCFAAFSIRKRRPGNTDPVRFHLELPPDILAAINSKRE